MKIDIVCSDPDHPVNAWLTRWQKSRGDTHVISICQRVADLNGGDVLFLVSCAEIVSKSVRQTYKHALVLHASDLPAGRGWSPHVWSILDGAEEITVSLLNAEDKVDTGDIWAKQVFNIEKDALFEEISIGLFDTELALMDRALSMIARNEKPQPQPTEGASYWPKRTPADSELDVTQPLAKLFDQIRVSDPDRYPAYFKLHNHTYTIELRKVRKDD